MADFNIYTSGDVICYSKSGQQTDSAEETAGTDKQSTDYVHYRNMADKIQKRVYDGEIVGPHSNCLKECEEFIAYNLDAKTYGILFARCEGQVDKLRTTSDITEGLADHDIYKCLELLGPTTTFPKIARMIYLFRHAAALAVSGNMDSAMREAQEGYKALKTNLNVKHMAKTNASCIYGYINVQLGHFSAVAKTTKSIDLDKKNYILKNIIEGSRQVEMIEDKDQSNLWSRMFLVKEAFCYLNIGLHAEDIFDPEDQNITEKDMDDANARLEKAKAENWVHTDKRREMLYNRATAKLLWIRGHKSDAIKFLTKAVDISVNFKREKKVFEQIQKKWERQIMDQKDHK